MKKSTIVYLFLMFALVFTSWAPVQAKNYPNIPQEVENAASLSLTISNHMPKATTVNLTGPGNYAFYVNPGATISKTIKSGPYNYSYVGCGGVTKNGKLKFKKGAAVLNILPCPISKAYFYNKSSVPVKLKLTGWMNYNFSIEPRAGLWASFVAGVYKVELNCGGKISTFSYKFRKGTIWPIIRC
jgi:hypothetical protein